MEKFSLRLRKRKKWKRDIIRDDAVYEKHQLLGFNIMLRMIHVRKSKLKKV